MTESIYNCEDCDLEDEFDDMVACDDCSKWWHFVCAGVDARIKDKTWLCSLCKGKQLVIADDVTQLRISLDKITVNCSASEKPVQVKNVLATTDCPLPKPGVDLALPKTVVNDVVAQELKADATFIFSKVLPCMTVDHLNDLRLNITQNDSTFIAFNFFVGEVQKTIKKVLDVIMHKDVQKQLSWSGLRTTLPSFEQKYKPIVDAMNRALKERFVVYDYEVLARKLKTLLGKK